MRGARHVAQALLRGADLLQRGSTRLDPKPELGTHGFDALITSAIERHPNEPGSHGHRTHDDLTSNPTAAVLLVCVDDFDVVVAHRGSAIAREIRAAIAQRINRVVRVSDAVAPFEEDSVAVAWCSQSVDTRTLDAEMMASRIADQFHEPIASTAGPLPVTVSIGIATCHTNERLSVEDLRRQARLAARTAQRRGRSQISMFDRADHAHAFESYETERHLFTALNKNQIAVVYQPIVSLHSGVIVGNEASARWEDDLLGSVSPSIFLPIAEDSGLIRQIGRQVFETAMQQAAQWDDSGNQYITSVNLSNAELLNPELLPLLDRLLHEHHIDPQRVWLEISESTVMNDVAASTTILSQLKDRGFKLVIDHFGTGYSSLAYLRRLPVDTLKIDQSFVQSIYSRDDRVIARAIIDLAHTLGMTTVANGVQSRLQVEVLDALNCDMAQGPFLHEPTAAEQLDLRPCNFELAEVSGSRDLPFAPAEPAGPSVQQ